jgi:hypothetical protein
MMTTAPVGRPKHGLVRKDKSRTGAFAHIAAYLNGTSQRDASTWFRSQIGLSISGSDARAAAHALALDAGKELNRKWLSVDEQGYGLDLVLIRFPGTGTLRRDLETCLLELDAIRQVICTESTGELVAVAIVEDGAARRELNARLRAFTDDRFHFDTILWESHDPARATWRNLARRAASREGLR